MAQGQYDHPSYLTRQQHYLLAEAGASGTGCHRAFNSAMRLRQAQAVTSIAGTIGTNVAAILFGNGTAIPGGTMSFGTGGNNTSTIVTSTDLNYTLGSGLVLSVKNGLDATAEVGITIEMYVDPAASWTGSGN